MSVSSNCPSAIGAITSKIGSLAGRFDRQVVIDRPDRNGRAAILEVHMANVAIADGVHAEEIADMTPGFTGADLANLVNEAAIIATRRGAEQVTIEDFVNAVERIVAGSERKSRLLKPDERERVAYHEMGHALIASKLSKTDPVQKVSIIPRSIGALGYTLQRPTDDRFLITSSELKERMTALLAGRAAEELIYGEVSTGAADDLAKATDVARQSVVRFGMSPEVGQAVLEEQRLRWLGDGPAAPRQNDYSETTAREIDLAVRVMIDEALPERQGDTAGVHGGTQGRSKTAARARDDHCAGLSPATSDGWRDSQGDHGW